MLITLFALAGILLVIGSASYYRHAKRLTADYQMTIEAGQESFYLAAAIFDDEKHCTDFQIKDCNARGAALLGHTCSQLIGKNISEFYGTNPGRHVLGIFTDKIENGIHQDQFCLSHESSTARGWVQRRLVRRGDMMALTLHDISESKVHEEQLDQIVNSDSLTLLANRHWLMDFLPDAIARAKANATLLAVLLVDIDDFKNINDVLGHETGDDLLRSVALRLASLCSKHDSLVRLGGDEFVIVVEQLQHVTDAEHVAQRIVSAFEDAFKIHDDWSAVRLSIGISITPTHCDDAQALMKFADIAMYAAKINGKARYCLYQKHLSETLHSRLGARKAIENAVEHNEFVLLYQPRINAFSGEFCSMEALIRWNHPTRGLVQPNEFIALAEECGLIGKIGDFVIDETCSQLARWQTLQLPCLPVSINVSLKQFELGDLTAKLKESMQKYQVAPGLVEVELTESCMMSTHLDISKHLAELKSIGIKLLVDDFGTGYSSLSQLQQLDLDVLKVDRAFANELERTAEGAIFFKAIISMAHALDMTVVAEGIETEAQLRQLQELGCNEIQGFLIAPPLPAYDIPELLRQKVWTPSVGIPTVANTDRQASSTWS